ncbi:MAG: helix-turn-helix transcriptional regulator [Clostridia bacterium]|nr:helix-turn-helix transcriptional regulator [Clostridia bacterium]
MNYYQSENSLNENYNMIKYNNIRWKHHFHKNPEVIYVESGEVLVTCEGGSLLLHENDYLMIFPNSVHDYSTPDSSVSYVAVFSEDHVPEFSKIIKNKSAKLKVFNCPNNITSHLKEYFFKKQNIDKFTKLSCLYMICGEFLKTAELREKKKAELPVQKIIEYVEKNFMSDITMHDVAKELGYEYHYFSRCFGEIFHTNFKSFVNTYRIERAEQLMKNEKMSKTEIAALSGFGSVRSFNRVLREHTLKINK